MGLFKNKIFCCDSLSLSNFTRCHRHLVVLVVHLQFAVPIVFTHFVVPMVIVFTHFVVPMVIVLITFFVPMVIVLIHFVVIIVVVLIHCITFNQISISGRTCLWIEGDSCLVIVHVAVFTELLYDDHWLGQVANHALRHPYRDRIIQAPALLANHISDICVSEEVVLVVKSCIIVGRPSCRSPKGADCSPWNTRSKAAELKIVISSRRTFGKNNSNGKFAKSFISFISSARTNHFAMSLSTGQIQAAWTWAAFSFGRFWITVFPIFIPIDKLCRGEVVKK